MHCGYNSRPCMLSAWNGWAILSYNNGNGTEFTDKDNDALRGCDMCRRNMMHEYTGGGW